MKGLVIAPKPCTRACARVAALARVPSTRYGAPSTSMKTPERKSLLEMEAADTCTAAARGAESRLHTNCRTCMAQRFTCLQVAAARLLGRGDAARGAGGPVKPEQRDSALSSATRQPRVGTCACACAHAGALCVVQEASAATSRWLPRSRPAAHLGATATSVGRAMAPPSSMKRRASRSAV